MMPLNVTHTAIVTADVHSRLLSPAPSKVDELPPASSSLRRTLSTLVTFFADAYKSTFGFNDGPPLHDALTIAYIAHPDLFKATRYRVDIELAGAHTIGETVVDIWHYRSCDSSWGAQGRNCLVAQSVNVNKFFDILLDCIAKCDKVSPLNSN
ncbi:hypothetical protein HGRIS_010258 [Hohenbuehelia grisea]|uniref:Inosine/uridine-preferring nucleoside hydrolase domain-containing protein n=1 Tax=Hohenbuehelia grisea TaxID=104357 RepID=A0ABR3J443_9AGAR